MKSIKAVDPFFLTDRRNKKDPRQVPIATGSVLSVDDDLAKELEGSGRAKILGEGASEAKDARTFEEEADRQYAEAKKPAKATKPAEPNPPAA